MPKYSPGKRDLPKRSDYVGAISWLQAVRACMGENIVFALDEALMCQGSFGGRSDEFIVWVYGNDSVSRFNGVVVLGNQISSYNVKEKNGLRYTNFNRTIAMLWRMNPSWICRELQKQSASITIVMGTALREFSLLPNIRNGLKGWKMAHNMI